MLPHVKMDESKQAYKTRGPKTKDHSTIGVPQSHELTEGQHNCADGNDGSRSAKAAPENKFKLEKYK